MEFEIDSKLVKKVQDMPSKATHSIPVLDANTLSYEDFFENYMSRNQPCVIRGVADKWEATEKWVLNGAPNIDYLHEQYKDTKVIIYNCSERYFNSQKCTEGILSDYVQLWKTEDDDMVYYLKDWHLMLQRRQDNFYDVPSYFSSDWLNEYLTQRSKDDYRFVYVGQKGSWTPLHSDVFNSYSWSVNVCGKKRWVFFPAGEEHSLKDQLHNVPYDVGPLLPLKNSIVVIQEAGEAVFVPSGWYHQVWNLEDTISINHNWINGCNVQAVWDSLKNNLKLTQKEIEDCRDMEGFEDHCQVMLNAHFGMNYPRFFEFLTFIAETRLGMLNGTIERTIFHGHAIGINHIVFDLIQIYHVLEDWLKYDDKGGKEVENLCDCIKKVVTESKLNG